MSLQKKRSANWTPEEKAILREIISASAHIIEDKSTKTSANILKSKEWKKITNKFNEITGNSRLDKELKMAWKRLKLSAKANISSFKRQQSQTGGGEKPQSPSQEDLDIMAIAPLDFVVEINTYDSDAVTAMEDNQIQQDEVSGHSSNHIDLTSDTEPILKTVEEQAIVEPLQNNKENKRERAMKSKKEVQKKDDMRESIVQNNIAFKRRNLEMLEVEHAYNIRILKLKIKKLELEIDLLKSKNHHTI
ncbi:uncharacterized protein LOC131850426 [Achroia grisella]|uniref:uncharacterized protein LOC131850426 n=1 Tax=Achroia grisella TaxID=688607 RepID=UPI0027D2DED8|nr:uncharacterized protein LOC131850426 [Achroia grisella]